MKCVRCNIKAQSPGANGMCGSCWSKDTSDSMDWPTYDQSFLAAIATGKNCKYCGKRLYALPGDDVHATVCINCV